MRALADTDALIALSRRKDQAFSLIDAVSFEVMRRHKLTHAFAFDRHFAIAGFASLGPA